MIESAQQTFLFELKTLVSDRVELRLFDVIHLFCPTHTGAG